LAECIKNVGLCAPHPHEEGFGSKAPKKLPSTPQKLAANSFLKVFVPIRYCVPDYDNVFDKLEFDGGPTI